MTRDLHAGFHDPRRVPAADLERFLEHADRLPGIRLVQRALRRALAVRPGTRLLDAGCGIGLETARLAAENPETQVTGLDRNADAAAAASRVTAPALFAPAHGDRYVTVADMRAVARRARSATRRVIVLPAAAGHGRAMLSGTATEWSPLAATVARFIRRHAAGPRG